MKRIKISSLTQKDKLNALNEIRILASINNEYIINYKDAFYDDEIECLFIIMEYAEKGDL